MAGQAVVVAHGGGGRTYGWAAVRVVGYVSVSTDPQVDDGAGLDVQRGAVRTWCRAHGHRLVALVADEGVSGTLADRPALAEALALLREGKARVRRRGLAMTPPWGITRAWSYTASTAWHAIPECLMGLPGDLAEIDAYLDDRRFFEPFQPFFDPVIGRPSIPMDTYLRMMFLN